jgi:hypothetical protein
MARTILIDELHVALRAPRDLTAAQHRVLRKALRRPTLLPALARAVRAALRRYPSLRPVRVTVAR